MEKASELRIGNWLNHNCIDFQIAGIAPHCGDYAITKEDGSWVYLKNCVSIPLADYVLEKLGFEIDNLQNDLWYFKNRDFVIIEYPDGRLSWDQQVNLISCHQLQNLYHSLTGEELKLANHP